MSNYYTTITYSASATSDSKSSSSSGLSKKNRNIVIGCVVGIGVPLLLAIAAVIYFYCVRSTETNFINSDGQVVTAYSPNILTRWWYALIGKDISSRYGGDSPLGGTTDIDAELSGGDHSGDVSRRPTDGRGSHSNDLMLEEEKYYDEEGNELNARNY